MHILRSSAVRIPSLTISFSRFELGGFVVLCFYEQASSKGGNKVRDFDVGISVFQRIRFEMTGIKFAISSQFLCILRVSIEEGWE